MYILYDRETLENVEYTKAETKEECMWIGLSWLSEDWDYETWNEVFKQDDTLEDCLNHFNYEIKKINV